MGKWERVCTVGRADQVMGNGGNTGLVKGRWEGQNLKQPEVWQEKKASEGNVRLKLG